jgi:hypothetical protein
MGGCMSQLRPSTVSALKREVAELKHQLAERDKELMRLRNLSSSSTRSGGSSLRRLGSGKSDKSTSRITFAAQEPDRGSEGVKFWFLHARGVREETSWTVLPSYGTICSEHPEMLVAMTITLGDALHGKYEDNFLAISHRWDDPNQPDTDGSQLAEIRDYLDSHPSVDYLWLDWCCMPQGERSEEDQQEFDRMLPHINLLYLSMGVLLLVDIAYLSRFWTGFEAWLSMQHMTSAGLEPVPSGLERYTICCIHNAKIGVKQTLLETWHDRSPQQAREILSKPDVSVTNLRDKETQLEKIEFLDEDVRIAWAALSSRTKKRLDTYSSKESIEARLRSKTRERVSRHLRGMAKMDRFSRESHFHLPQLPHLHVPHLDRHSLQIPHFHLPHLHMPQLYVPQFHISRHSHGVQGRATKLQLPSARSHRMTEKQRVRYSEPSLEAPRGTELLRTTSARSVLRKV